MTITYEDLSQKQKNIVKDILSDDGTKRKRILGASGSGKTTIMAICAQEIINDAKAVLITYFTKSLETKLKDLSFQRIDDKDSFRNALARLGQPSPWPMVVNYHRFIYNFIDGSFNDEVPDGYLLDDYYKRPLFDYIFVDEMQDLKPNHIINLIKLLKPDGKICVFADKYQKIFNNNEYNQEEERDEVSLVPRLPEGAGFRGRWTYLDEIHRANNIIQDKAFEFAQSFLYQKYGTEKVFKPERYTDAKIEYYYFDSNFAIQCFKDIYRIYIDKIYDYIEKMSEKDRQKTTVLVYLQQEAVYLASKLKDNNIAYFSMFEENHTSSERTKEHKVDFNYDFEGVKVATVQSFKGLESPIIILLNNHPIDANAKEKYNNTLEAEFVALTRATEQLIIFNTNKTNEMHHIYKEYLKRKIFIEIPIVKMNSNNDKDVTKN